MSEIEIKSLLDELKEQTKWLKFLALTRIQQIFEKNITTMEQRKIFELTNGDFSTSDISNKLKSEGIKVSHMTVYNYWKKWAVLGIVIPSPKYKGRYEKIADWD